MGSTGLPQAHGLYDPKYEKDSCGIALVAHVKGERSHAIVADGLTALMRMSHRSASGVEENTGDGSGILLALPDEFFRAVGRKSLGFELPEPGKYGVGMWFLPRDRSERARCKAVVERFIAQQGQRFLGWRRVPTDNSSLGNGAKQGEPVVEQVFVRAARGLSQDAFERQLYLIRKQSYHEVRRLGLEQIDLYTLVQLLNQGHRLQRAADSGAAPRVLPGPERRDDGEPPRHRPRALLDQHIPKLVARAAHASPLP